MSICALRLLGDVVSGRCARRVERSTVAGLPALVAGRPDAARTLVFANACTPRGIETSALASFLGAVAEAGVYTVAPELPDVRGGRITPSTVDALVRVAGEMEDRFVLAGASTGGGLAIVAAADPRLAARVELVCAIGPYADLENVLRLATTRHYADDGILYGFSVEPRLRWAAERSLRALGDDCAAAALLENDEPERFDELYSALPMSTRAAVEALSPVRALPEVDARVEVAFDPYDTFFPPPEPRALERAGALVTSTPALGHVRPRAGLGIARLVRFADRTLRLRPALES
jgi:pimeloyl-ACP methyl ester carboxylesterase